MGVINTHGRGSIGTYVGNPNAHNLAPLLYNRAWMQAIGFHQRFSASSVDHVRSHIAGIDLLPAAFKPFTSEGVAQATGIDALIIRRSAFELSDAPTALVYGQIGTTTVSFGTTTSWLVDVVNTITGNLDKAGGAMFPLPAPTHLERSHYDLIFNGFSVRNTANYSQAVFALGADQLDEWEILAKIAGIAQGAGADVDPAKVDEQIYESLLRTPSGKVELAPKELMADLLRLEQVMHGFDIDELLLVGRRHLPSNNSWMQLLK